MSKHTALAAVIVTALSTPAFAASTLTLYTSQPNEDAQMTVTAFEKAHPDIEVKWIRDGTTKLTARLQAELAAGGAAPDVLLIADSVTMESLKKQDLLAAYKSPEASRYDAQLYDPQGYYYGTKLITTGIAYNTRAPVKPGSWQDLLKPELKNMTTLPSPLYSGAAQIHMATLMNDPQLGFAWYEKLKANGAMPQSGNGAVMNAITSGSKGYGVLVDYMAIREKAKGAPIEFVFPKEGVSIVTEPVAMLKKAKNPDGAKAFIDFVLSDAGQRLVLKQGYLPADANLPAPEGFPARESIKLMPYDPAKALADTDANKKRFADLFGNR
ncbi:MULTISPECIES: ABC transporter substrate-binding protein [unclassified Pseudescherichia]|jgi:iron(III) transport system substrate-binding protein|uniref:ABC transporter substrate-binding protein n=1 Tax=Pseudescherichia TaxID=2055880 RepID=UPI000E821A67|nr:ABC transporter substrate-binding protein [Pseudescherichia sp.]WPO95591.1 ABC transporter substrate-binding protein [Buttiauxella sp. HR94]HAZ75208.1 Fe(3+) ABC transporter substrate-binding protein [Enterobacteriaceae bacterium]